MTTWSLGGGATLEGVKPLGKGVSLWEVDEGEGEGNNNRGWLLWELNNTLVNSF